MKLSIHWREVENQRWTRIIHSFVPLTPKVFFFFIRWDINTILQHPKHLMSKANILITLFQHKKPSLGYIITLSTYHTFLVSFSHDHHTYTHHGHDYEIIILYMCLCSFIICLFLGSEKENVIKPVITW